MKKEDEKLNIWAEDIRKIKMTAEEKSRVLRNIIGNGVPAQTPMQSPYTTGWFFARFSKTRMVYQGLAFCLMVFAGGGMVVASKGSVPGNILYTLKVNIVEPIHGAFLFSPEAKIEYHGSLATERLIEAEQLESKHQLDQDKAEQLSGLLKDHTEDLNQAIVESISQQDKTAPDTVESNNTKNENTVTDFEANMKAHAKILDILNKDEKGEGYTGTASKDATNMPEAARASGEKIRKNLENARSKGAEQYEKRKDSVKSLIDSADTNINSKKEDSSPDRLMILGNTEETLNKAKKSFEEADVESKKGNLDGAYNKLLDSESSAKEAQILLQAGFKLGDETGNVEVEKDTENIETGKVINELGGEAR